MRARSDALANLLFDICLEKWQRDGWRISKHVEFDGNNLKRLLGMVDGDECVVHIYPHSKPDDGRIDRTLLHEMAHVGFDLCGEFDDNGMVNRLESYLWNRISEGRRTVLEEMLNGVG